MSGQIPRGPEHLWCPMWRKPMAKVCHTCPLWVKLAGLDANTGAMIDEWMCSFVAATKMAHETAKEVRQTCASVDTLRSDAQRQHRESVQVTVEATRRQLAVQAPLMLGDKQ